MKHVCEYCSEKIFDLGYPCHTLIDLVSTAFFDGKFLTYDQVYSNSSREITPTLEYLEHMGLLVSTEIGMRSIGIMPNLKYAYNDSWKGELCWCYLLNYEELEDDCDDMFV
jgi:hypothetical protein